MLCDTWWLCAEMCQVHNTWNLTRNHVRKGKEEKMNSQSFLIVMTSSVQLTKLHAQAITSDEMVFKEQKCWKIICSPCSINSAVFDNFLFIITKWSAITLALTATDKTLDFTVLWQKKLCVRCSVFRKTHIENAWRWSSEFEDMYYGCISYNVDGKYIHARHVHHMKWYAKQNQIAENVSLAITRSLSRSFSCTMKI